MIYYVKLLIDKVVLMGRKVMKCVSNSHYSFNAIF